MIILNKRLEAPINTAANALEEIQKLCQPASDFIDRYMDEVNKYEDIVSYLGKYIADNPISFSADEFPNLPTININPYEFSVRIPFSNFGFGIRAAMDDVKSGTIVHTVKLYIYLDEAYATVNNVYRKAIESGFSVFDGAKARQARRQKPE